MRLKVFTTVLLVFGIGLLFGSPWIIGKRPPLEQRREVAEYAVRFGALVMTLIILFCVTAVCAFIVARRQTEALRAQAMENMHELIEGTLSDHGRKQS